MIGYQSISPMFGLPLIMKMKLDEHGWICICKYKYNCSFSTRKCIVFYFILLYCTVVYCFIVLYYIALNCIALIALYCFVLYFIVLFCIVFCGVALYCIVLSCIVLFILYCRRVSTGWSCYNTMPRRNKRKMGYCSATCSVLDEYLWDWN